MSKPVAYSYGNICIPQLPTYDEASYPYVYIHHYSTAYAFSSALTVTKSVVTTKATLEAPFLRSTLEADENGKEYWTEWEVVTESTTIYPSTTAWANHDIIKTNDGSVYLAKGGDPTPVYLPEVLFDGEATAVDSGYGYSSCTIYATNAFMVGDTLRVTINGVSEECTLERVETSNQIQVGNAGLNGNDTEAVDDGGEWLLAWVSSASPTDRRVYFYIRTAGTYNLKVERIAIEGFEDETTTTLTERDLYKKVNGQLVKHTLYKKVGGELVKVDEYST